MENTELKRVKIKTSKEYEAVVGKGILKDLNEYIPDNLKDFQKAVIITDSNVLPLYEPLVRNTLVTMGKKTATFCFPAGETSKNLRVLGDILEFLAENKLTRSDMVIALGGGVTGDIAGFAAGIYLRGVRLIHIPTTFLAAVDSSVGGKTAVDLENGKNLAGLFYQPSLVLCDTETFKTLSDTVFSDGVSESLKHGIIRDEAFFKNLAGKTRASVFDEIVPIVARNIEIKAEVVGEDEFDRGLRQILNFGHTVGHGIEKCSRYSIPHGRAVAVGMAVMARACDRLGYTKEPVTERILTALLAASLPISTDISPADIYEAALSDKKRSGDKITAVIPEKIGACVLKEIDVKDLAEIINVGLLK